MPSHRVTDLLRVHRSTRELTAEQIGQIAEHASVVDFHSGDVVHSLGSPIETLLLLVAGELELSVSATKGPQQPIQYLGRDDQLGLLSLFQSDPFPVLVTATQDTVAIQIPKPQALRLLQDLPLWRGNMLQRLGPHLRQLFAGESRRNSPRLIAVLHATDAYRELSCDVISRLTELNERVGVLSDHELSLQAATADREPLVDANGTLRDLDEMRSHIASWSDCGRVVIDVGMRHETSYLSEIVAAADQVYCVFDSASAATSIDRVHQILDRSTAFRNKMHAVWILRADEPVASPVPPAGDVFVSDFKIHWQDRPESKVCTRRAGQERLIRHLRGFSLGLALGGGAARGMAHLGVLQVFEQEGIPIDRMSGTSAGALVGIPYAAGYTSDWLINAFSHDLRPGRRYRFLPYGDAWYALWKFRRGGWHAMLRKYLHDWNLEQLTIPFTSVAADLVSASEVQHCRGDAIQGLLESINLPGISRPICRDGMALVDGGVLNVLPASVLVDQKASLVVAVDVSAKINFNFAGNSASTPTKQMKVPSVAQTMIRVRTVQDRNIRELGTSAADLVIEPDVSTVELADFQHAKAIAVFGNVAAREALPELKRLLHEADPELFPT